jgi:hypothetical protein
MGGACSANFEGKESMKETDRKEDQEVNEWLILKWILDI